MDESAKGCLLIIGGAEDKSEGSIILRHVAGLLGGADLLTVLTTATAHPAETGQEYTAVFSQLGVTHIQVLNIDSRAEANGNPACEALGQSACVFMTGGDQLRLTSILGGTRAAAILRAVYTGGGLIVGTSAGASAMSATMIVNGEDNEPARKCTLKMAPGLGFLSGVLIDQHFEQRGRFGRLLCGVAENPDAIGIGIDEDTAVKVTPDLRFEVLGSNAVTVIDGTAIESTNVSELRPNEILAIVGVRVSVLPQGYGYDIKSRKVMCSEENEDTSCSNH